MAFSVNTSFDQLNSNNVNLDSARTAKAIASRDWLVGQLLGLAAKESTFPFPHGERGKHIKYGSFARKTKIRELDDVDLIYCLHADGTSHTQSIFDKNKYYINTANAGTRLKNLATNNLLNSDTLLFKLKASLGKIEHYSKADIHKKNEAVTLKLTSYEWNFDILPAFYSDTGFYLIPNGSGEWMPTNPAVDQNRATTINQKHSGRILQIIRTLKYWNRYAAMHTIPSYLFENIILNFYEYRSPASQYIDFELRDFWNHLRTAIYNPVYDPKGFDGDINKLTLDNKVSVSNAAKRAYELSLEAIYAETNEHNQAKAIGKWRQIFGAFPSYG